MFGATEDPLQQMVAEKGKEAITRADLLVVVLDGQHGLVPGDLDIVKQLRASGSPILAVVNKIDAKKAREATMQFYELGIDPMFEISAEHGLGISDLLDEIAQQDSQRARWRRNRDRGRRGAARSAAQGSVHRRHRPSQRRQVVAGQPLAARGADARQRDARHHARRGRHVAEMAEARLPHRRHRRHPSCRPGGDQRAAGVIERARGAARDPARRCRRDGRGLFAGRHRPGCRDCRRGRPPGLRHRHCRQQVGPDEAARRRTSTRSSTRSCGAS